MWSQAGERTWGLTESSFSGVMCDGAAAQTDLLQRYEDTSADDCVKQPASRELITVCSPAAQTASSLSPSLFP